MTQVSCRLNPGQLLTIQQNRYRILHTVYPTTEENTLGLWFERFGSVENTSWCPPPQLPLKVLELSLMQSGSWLFWLSSGTCSWTRPWQLQSGYIKNENTSVLDLSSTIFINKQDNLANLAKHHDEGKYNWIFILCWNICEAQPALYRTQRAAGVLGDAAPCGGRRPQLQLR